MTDWIAWAKEPLEREDMLEVIFRLGIAREMLRMEADQDYLRLLTEKGIPQCALLDPSDLTSSRPGETDW